jgi:hypothetical protein
MPFFIKPFFRKPFKLFATDADTGQPIDPNVHRKTRVTYYELANGSNGSKKLVAHKSPSNIAKEEGGEQGKAEAEAKPAEGEAKKEGSKKGDTAKEGSKKEDAPKEGSKKEGSKKGEEAKVEQKGNDAAFTPEEDEKLKALKAENTPWRVIAEEMGRAQHLLKARFKEINSTAGDDQGKKDANGKGGEGGKGQNDKEKQNGGNGGQGKQGKKGKKGGDNQQNNQKNDNKNNTNEKSNQEKKESEKKPSSSKKEEESNKPTSKPASINKPTSKPASAKPASISNSANAAANETRFTMTDWLTLQEDDMFSFGELQCLSELIGKDLSQSWQRVAAKFFDLTGRRIHPDDVRDKFERMAVMAQGGKGV